MIFIKDYGKFGTSGPLRCTAMPMPGSSAVPAIVPASFRIVSILFNLND